MQVWPAIDLRGGKCVRLQQGDYTRETVFDEDPLAVARKWRDQGGRCLHLVDLDAARDGGSANRALAGAIAAELKIPCQFGGGVRSEQDIQQLLELGLARLVVGTQALKQPDWFGQMCRRYPGRLVLGLDARDGRVATDGWLKTSDVAAVDLAQQFAHEPLAGIVYTDIARDGMLAGPNLPAMMAMQQAVPLPVLASGGVSCADDIVQLAAVGMAGCIVGRALYEGRVTLPEALQAARSPLVTAEDPQAESRRGD
jgi:phosphoribosylformimino-5-aminoimidazole carboxamide ribotide isomerase